jgi:DNA-binding MarR family transcriptional regulator
MSGSSIFLSVAEDSDSLTDQLYDFVYVYDVAFDRAAQATGLSAAQACLLLQLRRGSRTMGDLAVELVCDASNVTQLVGRLEARGLVARERDPADRRARRVSITAAGRRACRSLEKRFTLPAERVGRLTEREQRQLSLLLRKMLA